MVKWVSWFVVKWSSFFLLISSAGTTKIVEGANTKSQGFQGLKKIAEQCWWCLPGQGRTWFDTTMLNGTLGLKMAISELGKNWTKIHRGYDGYGYLKLSYLRLDAKKWTQRLQLFLICHKEERSIGPNMGISELGKNWTQIRPKYNPDTTDTVLKVIPL